MTELTQTTETTGYKKAPEAAPRTRHIPGIPRTDAPAPRKRRRVAIAFALVAFVATIAALILSMDDTPQVAPAPDALDRWLANNATLIDLPGGSELSLPKTNPPDALDRWLANNATLVGLPDGSELWVPTRRSADPDGLGRWLDNNPPPAPEPDGLGRWLLNNPQSGGELDALGRWLLNNPLPRPAG